MAVLRSIKSHVSVPVVIIHIVCGLLCLRGSQDLCVKQRSPNTALTHFDISGSVHDAWNLPSFKVMAYAGHKTGTTASALMWIETNKV